MTHCCCRAIQFVVGVQHEQHIEDLGQARVGSVLPQEVNECINFIVVTLRCVDLPTQDKRRRGHIALGQAIHHVEEVLGVAEMIHLRITTQTVRKLASWGIEIKWPNSLVRCMACRFGDDMHWQQS